MNTTDKPVKKYRLIKRLEDPCGVVNIGVEKDEWQWMARLALLGPGDCSIKTDWFAEVTDTPVTGQKTFIGPASLAEHHSCKKEQPFQWTDELVGEYSFNKAVAAVCDENYISIESFKASKQPTDTPKQERIEVNIIEELGSSLKHHVLDGGFYHPYRLEVYGYELPKEKFPAIKQAIESVLNDDKDEAAIRAGTFGEGTPIPSSKMKMYSQEQVDTIRKETWEAARDFGYKVIEIGCYKYPTIEEYLKKLNPPNQTPLSNTKEQVPLFTTEDGVWILKNEKYWEVHGGWELKEAKAWGRVTDNWNRSDIKNFSTKEAAEQYILENKPCLSLNDLLDAWDAHSHPKHKEAWYKDSPMYKNFESKAKQKLSQ